MPYLNRSLAAALAFGVLGLAALESATAQSFYGGDARKQPQVMSGMEGAGGAGGTGGGAANARGPVPQIAYVNRASPYARHVRTTTPPPMDPSRRIYVADCTQPFDSLGKGNLVCR